MLSREQASFIRRLVVGVPGIVLICLMATFMVAGIGRQDAVSMALSQVDQASGPLARAPVATRLRVKNCILDSDRRHPSYTIMPWQSDSAGEAMLQSCVKRAEGGQEPPSED